MFVRKIRMFDIGAGGAKNLTLWPKFFTMKTKILWKLFSYDTKVYYSKQLSIALLQQLQKI